MHKEQRKPFNQKHLIFAIIGVVIFAILLSFLTLKSPAKNGGDTKSSSNAPRNEYKTIRKNLDKKFNQNGRVVTVKEEHNINDSTSKHAHTVIIVKLTDTQTQKYLKTTYEAVQNGQATDDQKQYIYSIQKIISDEAKKLDNNYDVIQFVYKDGKKYIPVASSQKNKFVIQPVKITQPKQKAAA
ncbi:hypothetical protein [Companilactobacillus heilongjiangensis]|uniref:Uncharacterized protein n=1 Tax=Companilactobacillus heilongjiangensis TaxID=1074467 RepID=A0A0K2LFD5_9LACO|nr:hypothetical protein [Companilactobacillus heilongjiangensis]ALB30002.1 hypothetical protein JP39_11900 [Companilactobacillus heilongjiangensis]